MSAADRATLAGWLLRSPGEAADHCRRDGDLRPLVTTSLASVAAGCAVFGAVVGSFRGGLQVVYAAVKLPLAMIAALVLCVPAFHALAAVFGRPWPIRTVMAITLAAAARASLLLLAFAPALWLAYDLGLGYHGASVLAALSYATAGLAALGVLYRGLGPGAGRIRTILAFAAVFLAAGGQTTWMLRPYLVRPRTEVVPFLRARESVFVEALFRATRSAAGIYESNWNGNVDGDGRGTYESAPAAAPRELHPPAQPRLDGQPREANALDEPREANASDEPRETNAFDEQPRTEAREGTWSGARGGRAGWHAPSGDAWGESTGEAP